MSRLLLAALALSCASAHAEVYRCPQTYPGDDGPPAPITSATIMWGERPTGDGPPFPPGWITPDEKAVKDGTDDTYALDAEEPSWLICDYGATKRIAGKSHNGHEWGQRMGGGKFLWFVKLLPITGLCTVQSREIKAREPNKSNWTVTAICKS
jgi:hypothetical protein